MPENIKEYFVKSPITQLDIIIPGLEQYNFTTIPDADVSKCSRGIAGKRMGKKNQKHFNQSRCFDNIFWLYQGKLTVYHGLRYICQEIYNIVPSQKAM